MPISVKTEAALKLYISPQLKANLAILSMPQTELETLMKRATLDNPLLRLNEPLRRDTAYGGGGSFDISYVAETRSSLEEYVTEQIRFTRAPAEVKRVAVFLAGQLDERGYLDTEELPASEALDAGIALIQSLEPAGIGARSLAECLVLQLKRRGEASDTLIYVIENHLPDIAVGKIWAVATAARVSEDEARSMIRTIKSLDPRPCAAWCALPPHYVIPDVLITELRGRFIPVLNNEMTPSLTLQMPELPEGGVDDETARYIKKKEREALWLIRSINDRQSTLLRVAEDIAERQQEFFRGGELRLKPMTMRETAERLGVSPSTVTRACAGKHIACPDGTRPLRSFYGARLGGSEGEASPAQAKAMIRLIVGGENAARPLSDEAIRRELELGGVSVSRRSVAKYRSELGIQDSNARRRIRSEKERLHG